VPNDTVTGWLVRNPPRGSNGGTNGGNSFHDHVHLNVNGNYRVALLFAAQWVKSLTLAAALVRNMCQSAQARPHCRETLLFEHVRENWLMACATVTFGTFHQVLAAARVCREIQPDL
jgi:hypothetical protein